MNENKASEQSVVQSHPESNRIDHSVQQWDAQFWEWKSTFFGIFDVLAAFNSKELERLSTLFGDDVRQAASWDDQVYFFLDTANKVISPMVRLSYAFGGQYNGYPPYGRQLKDFVFQSSQYTYRLFRFY